MRKCVGGNGYLKNAGIGPIHLDYLWQTTAEGEEKVMILHTAKHILKHIETPIPGSELSTHRWQDTITSPSLHYLNILRPVQSVGGNPLAHASNTVIPPRVGGDAASTTPATPSFDRILDALQLSPHLNPNQGIDLMDSSVIIRIFQYRSLAYWKLAVDSYHSILSHGGSQQPSPPASTNPAWNPSHEFAWQITSVLFSKAVEHHARYIMVLLFFESIAECLKDPEPLIQQLYPCLYRLGVFYVTSDFMDNEWSIAGTTSLFSQTHLMQTHYVNTIMSYSLKYDLLPLTQAFDIPDRVLASALGRADGHVYEALFTGALSAELNQSDPYYGYNEIIRSRMDVELLEEGKSQQYLLHDKVFGTSAKL